ncbi:MAG: thiolase C-terminal domain-containing protein [Anaerolineales bacterium]
MTEDILIAGIGMTPVGEHWELSLRDLAYQAIEQARQEAGGIRPQALYVANMLSAPLLGQGHLGALLADFAGLHGVEAHTVEAAGASGGAALRQAYLAVRSGEIDAAMVVGVEKVSDRITSEVERAIMAASDTDYEAVHGLTLGSQAAMLMQRYLHQYEAPDDALAGFSMIAHENAVSNPLAMYRRALKPELYAKAGMVSEPLGMFDAAPTADGAAAIILLRRDMMPEPTPYPAVRMAGSAAAISALSLHDRSNPLHFAAAAETVELALGRAGVSPDQIDLLEIHDLFSITAALSLESSGFADAGQGWRLAADGSLAQDGRLPILTFGGSKARGDVGGATGVYQVAEAALQLQGRANENQIEGAKAALAQSLGGLGASCATHILQRV